MSRYENYEIKNNVFGTLSAPISSLATTIQLGDGQGQRFSENMLATLENIENGKVMKREIVLITAINGDVLTVTRKVAPCPANDDANTQGKVSYAFSSDDTISAYIDKEHFDKIDESINDIYDNGVNKLRTEVVSGLQIHVNGGPILIGSSYYNFDGGNLTLTDNSDNYVEIDMNGDLVNNTIGRGDRNVKISKITTSGGEITNVEDWRLGTVGGEIGGINIHELSEKVVLNSEDEFVITDSEALYSNKKVKSKNILGYQNGVCIENISYGDVVQKTTTMGGPALIPVAIKSSTYIGKQAVQFVSKGTELSGFYCYIGKVGNGQDVSINVYEDDNGVPGSTSLGSTQVLASNLTTDLTLTRIDFSTPVELTQYTKYWIVFDSGSVDGTNYSIIGGNNVNSNKSIKYDDYLSMWLEYVNSTNENQAAGYNTTNTSHYGYQTSYYEYNFTLNKDIFLLGQDLVGTPASIVVTVNGTTAYSGTSKTGWNLPLKYGDIVKVRADYNGTVGYAGLSVNGIPSICSSFSVSPGPSSTQTSYGGERFRYGDLGVDVNVGIMSSDILEGVGKASNSNYLGGELGFSIDNGSIGNIINYTKPGTDFVNNTDLTPGIDLYLGNTPGSTAEDGLVVVGLTKTARIIETTTDRQRNIVNFYSQGGGGTYKVNQSGKYKITVCTSNGLTLQKNGTTMFSGSGAQTRVYVGDFSMGDVISITGSILEVAIERVYENTAYISRLTRS